jgi:transcriptional regulator GlxA family with amidase domain
MSLSSVLLALEPLRSVNRFLQRPAYEIAFVGPAREPVQSGIGICIVPDAIFDETIAFDIAVIAAAYDQPVEYKRRLQRWLRLHARRGIDLCGIDYGAVFMAEAGLLDGRRATTHWEVRPSIAGRFPRVEFREEIYVIDGTRLTCGGHLACHDLFLALVERDHGSMVARFVAADLISTGARPDNTLQGSPQGGQTLISNPHLRAVNRLMEENIEAPFSIPELAEKIGISIRQLQSLCRRDLGETLSGRYLAIRLDASRHMLMYSGLSVTEIAMATGFASPTAFTRAFKSRFLTAPRTYRRNFIRDLTRPYFFP